MSLLDAAHKGLVHEDGGERPSIEEGRCGAKVQHGSSTEAEESGRALRVNISWAKAAEVHNKFQSCIQLHCLFCTVLDIFSMHPDSPAPNFNQQTQVRGPATSIQLCSRVEDSPSDPLV